MPDTAGVRPFWVEKPVLRDSNPHPEKTPGPPTYRLGTAIKQIPTITLLKEKNQIGEKPEAWITPEKLNQLLPDISYAIVSLKGRTAKPKFRVYFQYGLIPEYRIRDLHPYTPAQNKGRESAAGIGRPEIRHSNADIWESNPYLDCSVFFVIQTPAHIGCLTVPLVKTARQTSQEYSNVSN